MGALIPSLALLLLSGLPAPSEVVARVNGEEISAADFREELTRRFQSVALDDAIADRLLEQEAQRLKVKVDEREIQRRLQALGGGAAAAAVRRNWLLDMVSKRATVIGDDEVRFVYESNKSYFVEPAQYRLRDLVVGTKEDAEQLRELLRAGGNFGELAKTFSIELASRSRGGDLGWLPLRSLAQALREVAPTMKPGEVSKPIELADEWHLLKLEGYKAERQKSLNEVRPDLHQRLFQEKQPMVRHNVLDDLRRKAKIEIRIQPPVPEPQR